MKRPQAEPLATAAAFFELVLRPVASGTDLRSGPTGDTLFFCGEEAEITQRTLAQTGAGRRRPKFLSGDPAEAARWVVAARRGWEADFYVYARWTLSRQSAVAVRLTNTFGGLLTCPTPPSFAVSSRERDNLHAVWLLAQGVDRAFGSSLANRIARRVHGYPTTLIPVPGTSDYELIVVSGAAYGFDELEDSFKRMPTARHRGRP